MKAETTRRAMMAGLSAGAAAIGATAVAIPAIAAPGDDPIFAALAKLHKCKAANGDDAYEMECEAELALFETTPTSPKGAAAFLRYIADYFDENGINDNLLADVLTDAMRNAVAVLEQESRA